MFWYSLKVKTQHNENGSSPKMCDSDLTDAGTLTRIPRIPCGGYPCRFRRKPVGGAARGPGKVRNMAAMLVLSSPFPKLRCFLRSCWGQLGGHARPWAPVLAIQAPDSLLNPVEEKTKYFENPSFLDSILWMPAPKSRRTIEVNRTRRRSSNHLIKIKKNIDICPECGNLKEKHVLCGYCYEKVKQETYAIKNKIKLLENGPHKAPTVESVVLYTGEKPRNEDEGKRIIERNRKRPSWFTLD